MRRTIWRVGVRGWTPGAPRLVAAPWHGAAAPARPRWRPSRAGAGWWVSLLAVGGLLGFLGLLGFGLPGGAVSEVRAEAVPEGADVGVAQAQGGAVFASVSAGQTHSCGVQTSGAVVCWGDNSQGQVSPVPAGAYIAVSASGSHGSHSCGVKTEGTVVCWGSNTSGQATPWGGTSGQEGTPENGGSAPVRILPVDLLDETK